MGKLKVQGVQVKEEKRTLLHEISFELDEGRTLVIIGESGSGKTLLSKLLIGKKPEDAGVSGEILFEGEDLLTLGSRKWQAYRGSVIAYIAQNPMALFNPMQTVLSHAQELFKSRLSLNPEESLKMLIDALSLFHLKNPREIADKYPFQLSGGMLQRIMFAMMMQLRPKLIIADEPTSALDRHNTRTIIDTLRECQQAGVSMIIITHDYELVHRLADDVIVMREGRIIEQAPASVILKNPATEYAKALLTDAGYTRFAGKEKSS